MKKIINKKSLKGTLAVMLCAVMAFSVCACDFDSDTEPTKTDAQIQFDKYCDDLFSEELEDDALTAHFDISNPSDYGLKYDEEDYTLGHVSDKDTKESFDELKEAKTDLEEFDRSGLTSSQSRHMTPLKATLKFSFHMRVQQNCRVYLHRSRELLQTSLPPCPSLLSMKRMIPTFTLLF